MNDYMKLIESVPEEKKMNFLRKNWLSHDARWQMEVVKMFGWDVGNKLNHAVAKDMGKVMMFRMMKILGIKKVSNINELRNVLISAIAICFPPPDNICIFNVDTNSSLKLSCQKCTTHENIIKAGAAISYECGCFSMREGIFEALNLTLEQEEQQCLLKGDKECMITLKVKEWESLINSVSTEKKSLKNI